MDWGSSSFRAYRFDSNGEVIDFVESADGIKTVAVSNFESMLLSHTGHWLQSGDTVLLSGMITSRNGWVETPYISCPLELSQLPQQSVSKTVGSNIRLLFLPGACINNPADVMRGEELQLYGAVQADEQLVVLPGTHSKWAFVRSGVLEKFHTVVTGELFDVLIKQTLIGGLASEKDHISLAFSKGVHAGYNTESIVSQLFTARSGVLLDQLKPADVYSYLSGLLIGNEIKDSKRMYASDSTVLIVGSCILCTRYAEAFELLGINAVAESPDAAGAGFQKLIIQQDS